MEIVARPSWGTLAVVNLDQVDREVIEHTNRTISRLRCMFQLPDSRRLSMIRFHLFPLTARGEREPAVTPTEGKVATNLNVGQEVLLAELDPGRRFAFGYEFELLQAHEYEVVP